MKTLQDFKNKLTPGLKIHTMYHLKWVKRDDNGGMIYGDEDKGVRDVSIVQSNSFALKTAKTDGTIVDSWCAYPKAKECIIKDNSIEIYEQDSRNQGNLVKVLTYTIL